MPAHLGLVEAVDNLVQPPLHQCLLHQLVLVETNLQQRTPEARLDNIFLSSCSQAAQHSTDERALPAGPAGGPATTPWQGRTWPVAISPFLRRLLAGV
jgi:hypothetical protein